MKRAIAFLLAVVMLFSLAACGAKRESAQSVAEKAIQAVQKFDDEQMQNYWGTSSISTGNSEISDLNIECVKAMFANLTYEVVSSEENDSTAAVNVKFTNIDVAKAFTDALSVVIVKSLQNAFGGAEDFDEDAIMSEELLKALQSGSYDKVTKEATINLILKDDAWVIDPECKDAVFNAMLADLDSATDGFAENEDPDRALISEVRNWAVDLWNDGICEMQWYYGSGTNSSGGTIDPEFTISQMAKEMEKKADYDAKMAALPDEYAEIADLWAKVSGEIDVLYSAIQEQGTSRDGAGIDVSLYEQYFGAFDDAVFELD